MADSQAVPTGPVLPATSVAGSGGQKAIPLTSAPARKPSGSLIYTVQKDANSFPDLRRLIARLTAMRP